MSPANESPTGCHGTLVGMTGKGTTKRTIRIDPPLWSKFGAVAERLDRDRADLLRDYARYLAGEIELDELPKRPERT